MSNVTTTEATEIDYAARIRDARAIGKGERLTDERAPEIVASLPEGFDRNKRGAVKDAVHLFLTGETERANRPNVATGGKGEQKATDYGRGVNNLTNAVNALLKPESAPDYLALVRQAAKTAATKGKHGADAIERAVSDVLAEFRTEAS